MNMNMNMNMKMKMKDLEYLAELSQFALCGPEKENCLAAFEGVLRFTERLRGLDTQNVPPTTFVLPLFNVFRQDEALPGLSREEALANAPEQDNGYFIVPRIL